MKQQGQDFSPNEKLQALKRHFVDQEDISVICDNYGIDTQIFHAWHKQLFDYGNLAFEDTCHLKTMVEKDHLLLDHSLNKEQVYELIIDALPDPIMIHDLKGKYWIMNQAVSYYLGISREDLVGEDESIAMDPETAEKINSYKRRVLAKGEVLEYEVDPVVNNTQYHFLTTRMPLFDSENNIVGTVGICRNISSRKTVERLKEDIERISRHDLKSPLNSIISLPQLMLQDENLNGDQKENLKLIQESGYRMLNMVDMSLSLYKMEKGTYEFQPVNVDIMKVLDKVEKELSSYIKTKDVKIDAVVNAEYTRQNPFYVLGEELLCHSMLSNLLKNSIEASPRNNKVTVTLTDHPEENCKLISIHNYGAIPEHIRESFGEKYATSGKNKGTGLGVYSARLIIETMNGNFSWSSSREQGTRLNIILPAIS